MTTFDENELMTVGEVAAVFGVTAATIRGWSAIGLIPRPVAVTSKIKRWRRSDLNRWLDQFHTEQETQNGKCDSEHASA